MDWTVIAKLARSVLMGVGGFLVAKGVISSDQSTRLVNAMFDVAGAASIIASIGGVIYHHYFPSTAAVKIAVQNEKVGTYLGRAGG